MSSTGNAGQVITISREYGAGGHSIGCQVAERLGIPFYDKDIVRETAKASGFDTELIENEEEDVRKRDTILKTICAVSSNYYRDTQDAIHDVQKAVIQRLALQGPCVILGRCADEYLREAGIDSLNVFIHADDVHRAVRVSELIGSKNATEIQKLMAKKDNSRHTYYKHYTGKEWGDGRNYHMTLDSGKLGYELCVRLIVEAVQ
ncbi:MAG: cytidylate kinase-like family protein [Lachnospiraceae bacterium]|nr:cytidylate kinase-like family protein [Lachnospiraceae bacterium]